MRHCALSLSPHLDSLALVLFKHLGTQAAQLTDAASQVLTAPQQLRLTCIQCCSLTALLSRRSRPSGSLLTQALAAGGQLTDLRRHDTAAPASPVCVVAHTTA